MIYYAVLKVVISLQTKHRSDEINCPGGVLAEVATCFPVVLLSAN